MLLTYAHMRACMPCAWHKQVVDPSFTAWPCTALYSQGTVERGASANLLFAHLFASKANNTYSARSVTLFSCTFSVSGTNTPRRLLACVTYCSLWPHCPEFGLLGTTATVAVVTTSTVTRTAARLRLTHDHTPAEVSCLQA